MIGAARRNPAGVAIALAALCCVVLLLAVFAPRWWGGGGGTLAPPEIAVATHVEPAMSLFADAVTMRADVLVDSTVLDPSSARVDARFTPFRVLSQSRRESRLGDNSSRIEFEYRIQCVSSECLTAGAPRDHAGGTHATAVALRPARVTVDRRDAGQVSQALTWPPLKFQPRLTQRDLELGRSFRGDFPVVEPSLSIDPDLAGGLLVAAASAFALLGAGLLVIAVRRRPVHRALRFPAHMSPLARAVALVRDASASGDLPGERRALQRLASELDRSGEAELSAAATRIAWSEGAPPRTLVDALVDQVDREVAA